MEFLHNKDTKTVQNEAGRCTGKESSNGTAKQEKRERGRKMKREKERGKGRKRKSKRVWWGLSTPFYGLHCC